MELKGTYIQTIFKASDSSFKVIIIKANKEKYTISGNFPNLEEGLNYKFIGDFVEHIKYGKQFKATNYQKDEDSINGLINYLASDKFYGIGKKLANNIVKTLGNDALKKISEDKANLDKVKGLTEAKKTLLYETIKNINEIDDIYIALYNLGLTNKMATKLYDEYGINTLAIIKNNPYCLIYDVEGFGFKKADNLALNLGIEKDNPNRIKEAILYCLNELCYKDGNVYIYINDLIKEVNNYLELNVDLINKSLSDLIEKNRIKNINDNIYPNNLYNAEFNCANSLNRLLKYPSKKYDNKLIDDILKDIENKENIKYTNMQKTALQQVLNDKIGIITGGPGTGKTTIVKGIIKLYSKLNKIKENPDILLLAPTGRAAKRLKESCNLEAYTIHRGLGYDYNGQFTYNSDNFLPYSLIIVDESSMIDIELANKLLSAINPRSSLIFIGDENQLPSVGPGEFLHDLIASNLFKIYRLNEIMRQASNSNIIKLANMVLKQNIDDSIFKAHDEVFFYNAFPNNFKTLLKKLLDNYLAKGNDLKNIQVLIPLYSGNCGIDEINKFIQDNYNLNKSISLKTKEKTYYVGDKVLQLQNNPEKGIMNGDIGYIIDIFDDTLGIDFNGKIVRITRADLENLTLAYAISVHKSQGSEYENVIFPIFNSYSIMLKKKLIYTAITRAKKKLILVGDLTSLKNKIKYKEKLRNSSLINFLIKKELTPYDFL